jgi:tetratricopeptide (TPR) repeat protein
MVSRPGSHPPPPPPPPATGKGRPMLLTMPKQTQPNPIRPVAPADDGKSGFDRQLSSLFGDSLFGPWLDSGQYQGAARTTRRHGSPLRRLAILILILGVGAGATWLVRAGLVRRKVEDRDHVAHSLETFLKEGELDRAAQFLALVHDPKLPIDAHDPHLDLIVRGEATLYRYQDADPERLVRIKPHLASPAKGSTSQQQVLASLAVASRQERADRLAEFEPLRQSFDKDPEFHYLLATAHEHQGDAKAAAEAWDRSFDLGPLWLGHRYEQAWFESRQKRPALVTKIVNSLVRVAPESAWSRLTTERFGAAQPHAPTVLPASSTARPTPAVAVFHQHLATALAEARAGDEFEARRSLSRAIEAINEQAPFIFDTFDWLMEAKASRLARELTGFESWPRHSQLAAARLARLTDPESAESSPSATESESNPSKQIKKPGRTKAKAKAIVKTRRRK